MWSGGGEKFSFRNQHIAGERNFISLATALAPLLNEEGQREIFDDIIPSHLPNAVHAVNEVYRVKLGLQQWNESAEILFNEIDDLMEETEADYTLFWRQLCLLPEMFLPNSSAIISDESVFSNLYSDDTLMSPLRDIFYQPLSQSNKERWASVLRKWLRLLHSEQQNLSSGIIQYSPSEISNQMRRVNPKYVPREWMLIEAYKAAARDDMRPLKRLQVLFETPYDEHSHEESSFYRKVSADLLDQGGVTCMT
jgi:uncharacterized protein YdiU (UPF0061 family)